MIPSKFELRDIIAYLVPSVILIAILILLNGNSGIVKLNNLGLSKVAETGIILSFLYLIGFYLRFSFAWFLRFKTKGLKSKFLELLIGFILGKPNKKDLRKSATNDCIEKSKWKTELENQRKTDRFYIVKNYVSQYASDSNLFSLERAYMSFTLAHRMTVVFFISTILSIIFIILKAFKVANTEWNELVLILILSIILSRISFRLFQKFFDNWCRRNIRIFITLNELKEQKKKKKNYTHSRI